MNNSSETTGQVIQQLLNEIPDTSKDLREKLQKAVADLELHKSYGLRFERHTPEVIDVNGEKIGLHTPYYPYLEHKESIGTNNKNPEHILMECDNYVGLKYLQYTHQNKVDVIYIDPPYNTGNKDWKYNDKFVDGNDSFRHSKWLSFIEKRLKLAKNLLSDQGVIFISIDDNEQANLKILCDEILGEKKFVATIPWKKRASKSDVPYKLSQDYEWVLIYANQNFSSGKKIERKYYTSPDYPNKPWRTNPLTQQHTSIERPNSFFNLIDPETKKEYPANPDSVWRITKETSKHYIKNDMIIFPNRYPQLIKNSKPILRVWKEKDDLKGKALGATSTHLPKEVGMTSDGTKTIKKLFGNKAFPFSKPTNLLKHLINLTQKENPVILDFFAGSGTTLQAVAELNAEDGGNRQCILMTNNEGNICEEVTWPRVSRVLEGYKEYKGHENQSATYYKMGILPEDKIEKTMRGWKATIEPYLPLISTKYNVPFTWERIKDVKLGFISKDVAIMPDVAYLEWKWQGLKNHKIKHLCIIGNEIEDFEAIKKELTKNTSIESFSFLPRNYIEHFENFHAKGNI